MSEHTPGPWSASNRSWCDTYIIAPTFDHAICCLDINHATEESQEADEAQMAANARLISAAPDLLAICQRLAESAAYWSEYDVPLGIVADLQDAIGKATGAAP